MLIVIAPILCILAFSNWKLRGLTSALQETLQYKHEELLKARGIGDRLLLANEEMTREGLTPQKVVEAIQKDPTLASPVLVLEALRATPEALQEAIHTALIDDPDLFADVIDLDALLKERGITHDWHKVGDRQVKVPKDKGKGFSHFTLITDMCRRCRMEHQYFRDGGHPSIDDREGFYLGGKRVAADKTPACLVWWAPDPEGDTSKALDG